MLQRRNKLSKPHFNLRDKTKLKVPSPILLFYNYSRDLERLQYSIGEVIAPEYWDQSKQEIKVSTYRPTHAVINQKLIDIKLKAKEIVNKDPFIDHESFKTELDYFLGVKHKPVTKSHPSLFEFIENYIKEEKEKVNAKSTWKKYHTLFIHLKKYASEHGQEYLDYDDIDSVFRKKFENWCYSKPREHSQNNLEKNLQTLSSIMKKAYSSTFKDEEGIKRRYHNNEYPFEKEFQTNRVKTSKYPLSFEELNTLLSFNDLPAHLMIVKDYFLMSAFSGGYRYSDYSRIDKNNIFEEGGQRLIRLFTTKGDTRKFSNEVIIPIFPEFQILLDKYEVLPKPKSPQKSNEQIKKICELAKINRIVEVQRSVGGKLVSTREPICKLISNHTARYSFINIAMYHYDIPIAQIANITGQSIQVLLGYERGNKTQIAIKTANLILGPRQGSSKIRESNPVD